jgi:predicted membrane protein
MGCLFSSIFWGVIIIIIGIVVIINVIFGTKIPIIPLIIGLILIYFGVRIITGLSCRRSPKSVIFEEKKIETTTPSGKYDVIFGRSVIDLTKSEIKEGVSKVEINTIFGSSVVKIDPMMPVKIKASSAFGSGRLPDGNMVAFGEYTYKSDTLKKTDTEDYLLIELHVVFGSAEVVAK